MNEQERPRTKGECWEAFWAIALPAVLEALQREAQAASS
jgi:hypothetical protein